MTLPLNQTSVSSVSKFKPMLNYYKTPFAKAFVDGKLHWLLLKNVPISRLE